MTTAALALLASLALGACASSATNDPPPQAAAPASASPPYRPVASVLELMESVVAHAAEEYWDAVKVTVDANGVTEHYPETDEEWEEVWAAAVTIAESGNLLMMPPRAREEPEWLAFAQALIATGEEAAAAALSKDPDQVFAAGERVYNACLACHLRYVPQ
jgi:cytochrome c556